MQKINYYIELIKPRLTIMALFSGAVGYVAAVYPDSEIDWLELTHLVIGLGFVGAASDIINQVMEHKLDGIMERTSGRPIPTGRVATKEAWILGSISLVVGLIYLYYWFSAKPLITFLAFLTFFSYVAVYTPMKTRSTLNTVVGALPGALPILTGWIAYRGMMDFHGYTIFAILFIWQLPHFFSIAWIYKDDYRKAGYKMVSLYDDSGKQAVSLIILGTIALIAISFVPFLGKTPHTGIIYFIGTFTANSLLLVTSLLLLKNREKYMKLYFYGSISWLPFVLTLMMIDRV